jgi:hypothetical protein
MASPGCVKSEDLRISAQRLKEHPVDVLLKSDPKEA